MLQFNTSGLLVPNKNIPTTLSEFQKEFVFNIPSIERQELYQNYVNYSNQLKKLCGGIALRQWLDGSYVTKNKYPKDIDLVTFIDYKVIEQLQIELTEFKYPYSELNFNVDAYIVSVYPANHKKNFVFFSDHAYWMDQFDKTKRNNRGNRRAKGFIEIIY